MRNFIIWTLSFLLVFEPAVWAANRPTINEMKAMIEYTEIGKKSMTLKELYGRMMAYLPENVRKEIEPMVQEYGDYVVPKFNVSKIKNSQGEEYYQLSAVKDGKSVTLALGESEKAPVKINGKALTNSDMWNFRSVLSKGGVTAGQMKAVPEARKPAQVYIMNSKQIDRLSKDQQRTYFKQMRELLESMEAVDKMKMNKGKKTSSRAPASLENFASLMLGEQAIAGGQDVPGQEQCVAAGYITEISYNPRRGGASCGADKQGGVRVDLRGNCSANQFQCNPVVYGKNGGCVDASRETTRICNERVTNQGNDIPDTYQNNKKEFEALRATASAHSAVALVVCGTSSQGVLAEDQQETCNNFNDRNNTIANWDCGIGDFKSKYPKLCDGSANEPGPNPGNPPGNGGPGSGNPPGGGVDGPGSGGPGSGNPPGNGGTAPGGGGPIMCNNLPNDMSMNSTATCDRGSMANGSCLKDDGNATMAYKCYCDDGKIVGKLKCDGGFGKGDFDKDGKGKKKKKKSGGPNWLLIGIAGLVGIGAMWWLSKKALKQNYKNIDPLPEATPVPVDPVAPPGAR